MTSAGTLHYQSHDHVPIGFNTITTPRAGQFEIVLADQTKVWLNAQSSIRFPTVFTGATRDVELTGEAYFEVKHSKISPFRVHFRREMLEDIGTTFNINAYQDEPIITVTLRDGSAKLNGLLLSKPGDQVNIVPVTGHSNLQRDADLQLVMAWRNG